MLQSEYPLVKADFFIKCLLKSKKIDSSTYEKIGKRTHFVLLKGNKAYHKKAIIVQEVEEGEINFMQATGLAAIHGFMGDLLSWYKTEKNWSEGAYIKNN